MEVNYLSRFTERLMIFISVTSLLFAVVTLFSVTYFEYIFLGVCELLFILLLDTTMAHDTSFWVHIRFWILAEILIWFLMNFFQEVINVYVFMVETSVAYFLTVYFFKIYLQHELFEEQCDGKQRAALESELFNNRFISEDFLKAAKSFKAMLLGSSTVMVFTVAVMTIGKVHFSDLIYIFVLLYIFSAFIHGQLLNQYRKEIYYAFLGLDAIFAFRNLTLLLALGLCAICLVVALLLSSNYAILKPQYFTWVLKFFKVPDYSQPADYTIPEMPQPELPPVEDFTKLYAQRNDDSKVGIIIDLVLIGAIVLVFLYFLLKPLFTSSWKSYFVGKNVRQIFTRIKKSFIAIIKQFFSFTKFKQNYSSTNSGYFKETMSDFIKMSKKSKKKKAELDRLTSVFMDLIDWGEAHEIPYTNNLAPVEYTSKIKMQQADVAGRIFEKALYSDALISSEEEAEFKSNIQEIISK